MLELPPRRGPRTRSEVLKVNAAAPALMHDPAQLSLFAEPPVAPRAAMPDALASLLDVRTIYHERAAADYARGREILARFPTAERVDVASHQNIPGLYGNAGAIADWVKIKRMVLVLGVKKSLQFMPYSRNCDWVAPSLSNGCAMACAYCYVPRRKGFANPVTTFVNVEQICAAIRRHSARLGQKTQPTAADSDSWVYEIGTNGDCSVDAAVSDNVRDLVELFRELPHAKLTFATKFVNREMLDYDPRGKTRVRFSLLPAEAARLLDVRASGVAERVAAINDFVAAGYETNINFGPVIYAEGWLESYRELFRQIDDTLTPRAKQQLQAEVIFLTHNEALHEVNLGWHPRAEAVLWRPEVQEGKVSGTGGANVRYRLSLKKKLVQDFRDLLAAEMPYCRVRYAF